VPAPAKGSRTVPRLRLSSRRVRSTGLGVASHRLRGWEHPAEGPRVLAHDASGLSEAEQMIHPLVPALAGSDLDPESPGLEPPARAPEPAGDRLVDPDPLHAIVPIPDHEPEVAIVPQDPPPLGPELESQCARVTLHRRSAAAAHQIRGRGEDDAHASGGDRAQRPAVRAKQQDSTVRALPPGHDRAGRRGRAPARRAPPAGFQSGYGMNSSAISTSPGKRARASLAIASTWS